MAPVTLHEHGAISLPPGEGWEDGFGSRGVWVDVNPVGAEWWGHPGSQEIAETRVCVCDPPRGFSVHLGEMTVCV